MFLSHASGRTGTASNQMTAIVEVLIAQHVANDPLLEIAVKGSFLLRLYRAVADSFAPLAQDFELRGIRRGGAGNMALIVLVLNSCTLHPPASGQGLAAGAAGRQAGKVETRNGKIAGPT